MLRTRRLPVLTFVLVSAAVAACGGGRDDARPNFRLVLHDGPSADVDEVWITFDQVSVKPDEGSWLVVDETVQTVDLKSLTGGAAATLALATLPQGLYGEIRLHISQAHVVAGGVEQPLTIPSGSTSGLKLQAAFEAPECGAVQVTLDWDLAAHLHVNKGRGYLLQPTIAVDTTIDDSACCDDPPCTRLGNCLVTARDVEGDRDVAAAVAAGVCTVVAELPPSTPQTRAYPPPGMPRLPGEDGTPHPRSGDDGDNDGIPDGTEMQLARRFFPNLNMHFGTYEGTINADRSVYYGDATYAPGTSGHLAFAARVWGGGAWPECPNGANKCIEIRYTIAYNWDLGDDLFGDDHRGDSEFYAVLLQRAPGTSWDTAKDDPSVWYRIMDFMSAHKCTPVDSSRFRWSAPQGGAAPVWAAEGKHANYPSQSACNGGGFLGADDCGDHRVWVPRGAATAELANSGMPEFQIDPFIPFPGSCKLCAPAGSYNVWDMGLDFANSTAYGKHMKSCLWWDSGDFGCGTCPYGGSAGPGGGCAATGDACGQAPDGCFCDAYCILLGDCCPDACSACGVCPGVCGDGICEGTEDACCTADCPPACGDGICGGGEDCTTCPDDCPECGVDLCGECAATGGACGQAPSGCWCDAACVTFKDCCSDSCDACGVCGPDCGNGVCAPGVEDNCTCPADCPPVCGNGTCDCEESDATCPSECGCGATAGACGMAPEGCFCDAACVGLHDCCADACDACGNCDPCGNGVCAPFVEDSCNCPADCPPVCGNGACDCGETDWTCPSECGCAATGNTCGQAPNGCRCDPVCGSYGDCCADACVSCGSCDGTPGLGCGDTFCSPGIEDNCNCPSDCPPVCGNGMCDCHENCVTCPGECGACAPGCGDGTCEPGVENCLNCPPDCPCAAGTSCSAGMCLGPTCGDGACEAGETCDSCPSDCGDCPVGCGDGACEPLLEDCATCPVDCGPCGGGCGDMVCAPVIEDCGNCPGDCPCWMPGTRCEAGMCVLYCGNGTCEPFVEDNCNCPVDCPPVCGNGMCDCAEDCITCPSECGSCGPTCGDGSCDYPESCFSCAADCGPAPCSP